MSMQLRRNVVFCVGFAVFAIAISLVPGVHLVFSLFVLVLALTIPVVGNVLWHDSAVSAARVPPGPTLERRL